MSYSSSPWIRCFHPAPASTMRLVCLPHAGGSANAFRPLSAALGASVEVLAVQYPGRHDRFIEPPLTDIHRIADDIAGDAVLWADQPWAIFGHSMGALVGFEVARRLGCGPTHLFVSGHQAPDLPRKRGQDRPIHQLDNAGLIAELQLLNSAEVAALEHPEIQQLLLPTVRADYQAVETYKFEEGPALRMPISAYVGDADPLVDPIDAGEWRRFTAGAFRLEVFPGDHFYLQGNESTLAQAIARHLAGAR